MSRTQQPKVLSQTHENPIPQTPKIRLRHEPVVWQRAKSPNALLDYDDFFMGSEPKKNSKARSPKWKGIIRGLAGKAFIFFALCFASSASAQSCQKQVITEVTESLNYSLPAGVDPSSLSNWDLVHMIGHNKASQITECLDDLGFVTTEVEYLDIPDGANDLRRHVSRTISNGQGTWAFDHNDSMVQFVASNEVDIPLSGSALANFGIFPNLQSQREEFLSMATDSGFTFIQDTQGRILALKGDKEIFFDPVDQVVETRSFDNDRLLGLQYSAYHELDNGTIVPLLDLFVTYDTLPNGLVVQVENQNLYNRYRLSAGDEILVDFNNTLFGDQSSSQPQIGQFSNPVEKRHFDLRIEPNPFQDNLLLDLPITVGESHSISITDLNGKRMASFEVSGNLQTETLHLPNLIPGVYVLNLQNAEGSQSFKIVKH